MTVENDPIVGDVLDGRYRILEPLGSGGMSVVYKAEHQLMKRLVANKLLHLSLEGVNSSRERFEHEAKALGALDHPHLIAAHDFGVTVAGRPYLVMPYLEGEGLDCLIRANDHIHPVRAVGIFIQICDALAYAHRKNVIHRDLKPSNIMLERDESGDDNVKIVDFGIAKLASDSTTGQDLTKTGMIVGSPQYMSPEQWSKQTLDARSDIYSFGCVMYETLCGRAPYADDQLLEIMLQGNSRDPRRFADTGVDEKISSELEAAVCKALRKDREKRQQSLSELRRDLAKTPEFKILRERQVYFGKEQTQRRKRLYKTLIAVGVVVILLISCGVAVAKYGATPAGAVELDRILLRAQEQGLPKNVQLIDDSQVIRDLNRLADERTNQGNLREAKELYEESLPFVQRKFGTDSLELAQTYAHLSKACNQSEGPNRAAGDYHIRAIKTFEAYAKKQFAQGHPEEGERYFQQALDELLQIPGTLKSRLAASLFRQWADLDQSAGDTSRNMSFYSAAMRHYEKALELWQGKETPDITEIGRDMDGLYTVGQKLYGHGFFPQAELALKSALRFQEQFLEPSYLEVGRTLYQLACTLIAQQRAAEAEDACRRALGILTKLKGPNDLEVAQVLVALGNSEHMLGRHLPVGSARSKLTAALGDYQRAVNILEPRAKIEPSLMGLLRIALASCARVFGDLGQNSDAARLEARINSLQTNAHN